jgi:hypothetical protein
MLKNTIKRPQGRQKQDKREKREKEIIANFII